MLTKHFRSELFDDSEYGHCKFWGCSADDFWNNKKKKNSNIFMVNWYTQYIGILQLTYLRDQDVLFYFTIFECLLLDYWKSYGIRWLSTLLSLSSTHILFQQKWNNSSVQSLFSVLFILKMYVYYIYPTIISPKQLPLLRFTNICFVHATNIIIDTVVLWF
jgi:hypothetical protein